MPSLLPTQSITDSRKMGNTRAYPPSETGWPKPSPSGGLSVGGPALRRQTAPAASSPAISAAHSSQANQSGAPAGSAAASRFWRISFRESDSGRPCRCVSRSSSPKSSQLRRNTAATGIAAAAPKTAAYFSRVISGAPPYSSSRITPATITELPKCRVKPARAAHPAATNSSRQEPGRFRNRPNSSSANSVNRMSTVSVSAADAIATNGAETATASAPPAAMTGEWSWRRRKYPDSRIIRPRAAAFSHRAASSSSTPARVIAASSSG